MEMQDEIELHKKGWVAQRIGWVLLALILIAASLGFFGNGLVSKRYLSDEIASVSYERFGRFETPIEMKVNANIKNKLELKIPQAYLRKMELDKIVPQPEEQRIENDNMIFSFAANDLAQVTVYFLPQATGTISTSVDINGRTFNISHFIYP